jgi:hypothetical protein
MIQTRSTFLQLPGRSDAGLEHSCELSLHFDLVYRTAFSRKVPLAIAKSAHLTLTSQVAD